MVEEITCDYVITARPIDKALLAEELVGSLHKVTKCEKCGKFHVWVRVGMAEWAGPHAVSKEARTFSYTQVGPNSYVPVGLRTIKKKKAKGNKVDDISEE